MVSMRKRTGHYRQACDDEDACVLISPSGRVVIDVCPTCGLRISVDGRVLASVREPITIERVKQEIELAAAGSPAVPAAELRGLLATDN
jgi:hypothetical protein